MAKKTKKAIITIDYEEGKTSTYNGILVSSTGNPVKRFHSKDIRIDVVGAVQYAQSVTSNVFFTSTYDAFISDLEAKILALTDIKDTLKNNR